MRKPIFAVLAGLTVAATAYCSSADLYVQDNLTSDLAGVAANQDPNLVNPWGLAAGPGSPFWVSDNGTGLSTIYDGTGKPFSLVVTIPPAGSGAPTGIVFNSTSGYNGSHFIFDTENGTIASWASGTNAVLNVTSPMGSVYKGLALGNNGLLYAANFGLGRVDVFNSNFQQTTVSGGFKDNTLPAGYAPFDVKSVGGLLYVTYALQDAKHHDDVSGPGHGFIDVFDTNGVLQQRLVSHGALNSPWGMAIAPSTFGAFSNDLLVGNFGDGKINAFNPTTGAFLGTLDGGNGSPIVIQGLWGLSFGNGAFGQNLDSLYFTAGIPGMDNIEDHGLFGSITAAPEPAPVFSVGIAGLALLVVSVARRTRRSRAGAGELA